MHDISVIVARNRSAAVREATDAALDGNHLLAGRILRAVRADDAASRTQPETDVHLNGRRVVEIRL